MSLPASSPLPRAFKLVHRILSSPTSSNGLTTKEIIREALKAHQSQSQADNSLSSSSASAGAEELEATPAPRKGKGKDKVVVGHAQGQKKNLGVNVVPDGHPFVSSTYLKTRVLAVLKSQNLISKSIRRAPSASSSSSDPSSSTSNASGSRPTFTWKLNETRSSPSTSTSSSSSSSVPTWDKSAHWDRLINGEAPGKLHAELTELYHLRKTEAKEQAFESKKARRSEREIWEWEGRADGLTTTLERLHLNKRRGEARPKKERRRIEAFETFVGGLNELDNGGRSGQTLSV
ncbi:hypothetical protein IAU59_006663 [Kwoniella sp. CBS 9459]